MASLPAQEQRRLWEPQVACRFTTFWVLIRLTDCEPICKTDPDRDQGPMAASIFRALLPVPRGFGGPAASR